MSKWIRALLAVSVALLIGARAHAAIDFTKYHNPAEVDTIMNDLAAAHPGLARVSTIGTSYEAANQGLENFR